MLCCLAYNYLTYYLVENGYTAFSAGLYIALFSLFAALIQPLIGNLSDNYPFFNWKNLLYIFSFILLIIFIILLFNRTYAGLLMGLFLFCISIMIPLTNSACFAYNSEKHNINYGIARAAGSLAYASCAFIMGKLTLNLGKDVVIKAALIIDVLFIICLFIMPYTSFTKKEKEEKTKFNISFIKRYPDFFIYILGMTLVYSFQLISSTYLIQIVTSRGGNSSDMGFISSLSAYLEIPLMFTVSFFIKKFSSRRLLLISAICFTVKAFLYYLTNNLAGLYLAQLIHPFCFVFFMGVIVYYSDERMADKDKVTGQMCAGAIATLATFIGSLLGGYIYDKSGISALLLCGVILTVSGLILVIFSQYYEKKLSSQTVSR